MRAQVGHRGGVYARHFAADRAPALPPAAN